MHKILKNIFKTYFFFLDLAFNFMTKDFPANFSLILTVNIEISTTLNTKHNPTNDKMPTPVEMTKLKNIGITYASIALKNEVIAMVGIENKTNKKSFFCNSNFIFKRFLSIIKFNTVVTVVDIPIPIISAFMPM